MRTVTKDDLINIGYRKHTAENIIREAKMVMVQRGYPMYNNKRLGVVPREAVEAIIGCEIKGE